MAIELKPWNECGRVKLEDNEHKKCACGIVTRSRLRLPYTKRVYVVCNSCFKDMGLPKKETPAYTEGTSNGRKVHIIGD